MNLSTGIVEVNIEDARTMFENCLKLTRQRYLNRSDIFIVKFERILNIVLVSPLLTSIK